MYNILFEPENLWKEEDRSTIFSALDLVGIALARNTELNPVDAFNKVYEQVIFRLYNALPYFAYSQHEVIWFEWGKVDLHFAVHELGHVFDQHVLQKQPSKELWKNGVWTPSGIQVTGSVGNAYYNRCMGKRAPANGYNSDGLPDMVHYRKLENFNEAHEDFADIFMNWVFNSFAPNDAGLALYNWMEVNIPLWLNR